MIDIIIPKLAILIFIVYFFKGDHRASMVFYELNYLCGKYCYYLEMFN